MGKWHKTGCVLCAQNCGLNRTLPEKFVVPPLGGVKPPEGGTANWVSPCFTHHAHIGDQKCDPKM